jgi:hypothetical protein
MQQASELKFRLTAGTHTCNPSYWGGKDLKNHNLKPTWKKVSETPISINKLGLVMLRCIPSQLGGNVRGSWSKAEKIKRISL